MNLNYHERTQELERELLKQALLVAQGNHTQAAAALGIKRTTFLSKLRRYSIDRPDEDTRDKAYRFLSDSELRAAIEVTQDRLAALELEEYQRDQRVWAEQKLNEPNAERLAALVDSILTEKSRYVGPSK